MARDQGEALQILGRIDDGAQATGQRQRRTVRGRGQREFIAQQDRAAERIQRLGDALLVAQVRVERGSPPPTASPPRRRRAGGPTRLGCRVHGRSRAPPPIAPGHTRARSAAS